MLSSYSLLGIGSLAEAQGWDAVTTRKLAERIEYSRPVLYSHFRGKREILGAVALEGTTELTAALRAAVAGQSAGRPAVAAPALAYAGPVVHADDPGGSRTTYSKIHKPNVPNSLHSLLLASLCRSVPSDLAVQRTP